MYRLLILRLCTILITKFEQKFYIKVLLCVRQSVKVIDRILEKKGTFTIIYLYKQIDLGTAELLVEFLREENWFMEKLLN